MRNAAASKAPSASASSISPTRSPTRSLITVLPNTPNTWPTQPLWINRASPPLILPANEGDGRENAPWTDHDGTRITLRALFDAAIASARPQPRPRRNICHAPPDAAEPSSSAPVNPPPAMAAALENAWPDHEKLTGVVVTRYEHACPNHAPSSVIEASHPIPDANSQKAPPEAVLEAVQKPHVPTTSSSPSCPAAPAPSWNVPAPGLTLDDLIDRQRRSSSESGAPIGAMNAVRKHLSAIKGGRLAAAAHPAPVITLAHQRRPQRRPGHHRQRPHHPRPHNLGRRPSHRRPIPT